MMLIACAASQKKIRKDGAWREATRCDTYTLSVELSGVPGEVAFNSHALNGTVATVFGGD